MSEATKPETDRQRFIRNTGESIRMMRAQAVQQRREGNEFAASRIEAVANDWQAILDVAEKQEAAGR